MAALFKQDSKTGQRSEIHYQGTAFCSADGRCDRSQQLEYRNHCRWYCRTYDLCGQSEDKGIFRSGAGLVALGAIGVKTGWLSCDTYCCMAASGRLSG